MLYILMDQIRFIEYQIRFIEFCNSKSTNVYTYKDSKFRAYRVHAFEFAIPIKIYNKMFNKYPQQNKH